MKRTLATIMFIGLVGLGAAPEPEGEVRKLAPFVGEWTIRSAWSDGRPLVAHNVNAWALSGTHLQGQTFVGEGDQRHQRYLSMMSYDVKKGCLVSTSYAADGAISTYRIETEDGKTFRFGFTPIGDEQTNVRQTITFQNADAYRWVVEVNQNGTWTQIMDGVWKRDEAKEPAR